MSKTLPNLLTRAPRRASRQLGDRRPRSRIKVDRRRCAHGLVDQQAGYLNGIDALLLIAVMALDMQAICLAQCGFLPDDVSGLKGMTLGYVQAAFSFRGKGRMGRSLGRREGSGGGSSGSSSSRQNDELGDLLGKYSPGPLAL